MNKNIINVQHIRMGYYVVFTKEYTAQGADKQYKYKKGQVKKVLDIESGVIYFTPVERASFSAAGLVGFEDKIDAYDFAETILTGIPASLEAETPYYPFKTNPSEIKEAIAPEPKPAYISQYPIGTTRYFKILDNTFTLQLRLDSLNRRYIDTNGVGPNVIYRYLFNLAQGSTSWKSVRLAYYEKMLSREVTGTPPILLNAKESDIMFNALCNLAAQAEMCSGRGIRDGSSTTVYVNNGICEKKSYVRTYPVGSKVCFNLGTHILTYIVYDKHLGTSGPNNDSIFNALGINVTWAKSIYGNSSTYYLAGSFPETNDPSKLDDIIDQLHIKCKEHREKLSEEKPVFNEKELSDRVDEITMKKSANNARPSWATITTSSKSSSKSRHKVGSETLSKLRKNRLTY